MGAADEVLRSPTASAPVLTTHTHVHAGMALVALRHVRQQAEHRVSGPQAAPASPGDPERIGERGLVCRTEGAAT